MNKKKIRDINKTRAQIIHDNFFKYLDGIYTTHVKITGTQYEKDNALSKTTVSNWRNNKSKMTVDHLFQAAKYFDITVNDLYYSEQEKLKISARFHDLNFDPINAQQIVDVKLLEDSFKKPFNFIFPVVIIHILIGYLTYFLLELSIFFILTVIIAWILSYVMFKNKCGVNKRFIISYLDDIYYKRNKTKNKYFFLQIVLKIFSILTMGISLILLIYSDAFENLELRDLTILVMLEYLLLIIQVSMSSTNIKINFKKEIYDDDIDSYSSRFTNFIISMFLLTSTFHLFINNIKEFWLILILSFINVIISSVDFFTESKNYSEYGLMYEENNQTPRKLFPKN